jgi:hypothetical protein
VIQTLLAKLVGTAKNRGEPGEDIRFVNVRYEDNQFPNINSTQYIDFEAALTMEMQPEEI